MTEEKMLSGEGLERERALVDDIVDRQGHEYHAALVVSLAILGHFGPLKDLHDEEREMVRELVELHKFNDAEWATPLFQQAPPSKKWYEKIFWW